MPVDLTSAVADALRQAAEQAIVPRFRALEQSAVFEKSPGDWVTDADHEAEELITRALTALTPGTPIVGEEASAADPTLLEEGGRHDAVWVLDPLDGTKSFIAGMPVWGTLIALTRLGEPVFGTMHQPFTRETFSGDGGAASYKGPNGKRDLRVRPCASLSEAILFTTSPMLMNEADRATFRKVEQEVRLSRYGGDCYAYCMLASGHIDLIIETELKPYDIIPLIPIVAGAGGIATSWEGGPAALGGRVVVSGDPRVHEAALKLLQKG